MPQIQADEIAQLLRSEIENFDQAVSVAETGSVISVGDPSISSVGAGD